MILGVADDGDNPYNYPLVVYAIPKLVGEHAELPAAHVTADDATNLDVVDQYAGCRKDLGHETVRLMWSDFVVVSLRAKKIALSIRTESNSERQALRFARRVSVSSSSSSSEM